MPNFTDDCRCPGCGECAAARRERQRKRKPGPPDVWVLTTGYNDYDQHGDYFVALFIGKPTPMQLRRLDPNTFRLPLIKHILTGGGRRNSEYQHYKLFKAAPGKDYQ